MIESTDFSLDHDSFGGVVLRDHEGVLHERVVPVRAFPIGDPTRSIALVDAEGHELAWINDLDLLPVEMRKIVEEELESREFMPEILRIRTISSFNTPCTWNVETDRGSALLLLKGEEEIRRLSVQSLLIFDANGIHFFIRDRRTLDANSRRILDRFL